MKVFALRSIVPLLLFTCSAGGEDTALTLHTARGLNLSVEVPREWARESIAERSIVLAVDNGRCGLSITEHAPKTEPWHKILQSLVQSRTKSGDIRIELGEGRIVSRKDKRPAYLQRWTLTMMNQRYFTRVLFIRHERAVLELSYGCNDEKTEIDQDSDRFFNSLMFK